KDGYKHFIAENTGLQSYGLAYDGALSQLAINPFTDIYTVGEHIVKGKTSSTTPVALKDGTFDSLDVLTIGPGTTQNYTPQTYGSYTEIDFLGESTNGDSLYFFVDNTFPGSDKLHTAVVKQSAIDVNDFILVTSTSSENNKINSPTESLEILG